MNKNLYRVVHNAARQMRVAVRETATSAGSGPVGTANVTATYMANDAISVIAAGNPGDALAAIGEFWNVVNSSNSAHSCYGTGANGCSTIANPVPGGPRPTHQQPGNVIVYRDGDRVSPKGSQ